MKIVKIVKFPHACDWGVRCVPPMKIMKIMKMVRACEWGVGFVPHVKIVKIVKIVKVVWAYGWGGIVYHVENCENCENGSCLWMGCGVCTPR